MDDVFPILGICGSFLRGLILALMKSFCFVPFSLRFFHREVWLPMDLCIHFLCFKLQSNLVQILLSCTLFEALYLFPFFRLQFPAVVLVRSFMGLLLTHGSTMLTLGPCLLGLGQGLHSNFMRQRCFVYKRMIQAQIIHPQLYNYTQKRNRILRKQFLIGGTTMGLTFFFLIIKSYKKKKKGLT